MATAEQELAELMADFPGFSPVSDLDKSETPSKSTLPTQNGRDNKEDPVKLQPVAATWGSAVRPTELSSSPSPAAVASLPQSSSPSNAKENKTVETLGVTPEAPSILVRAASTGTPLDPKLNPTPQRAASPARGAVSKLSQHRIVRRCTVKGASIVTGDGRY